MHYRITIKKAGETILTKTFDVSAKNAAQDGLKDALDVVRRDRPNFSLIDGDVSISIDPDA